MVTNHSQLPPLLPLEPSADRHHYSSSSHNPSRRGSTDPLLHASLAASAAAQHHSSNDIVTNGNAQHDHRRIVNPGIDQSNPYNTYSSSHSSPMAPHPQERMSSRYHSERRPSLTNGGTYFMEQDSYSFGGQSGPPPDGYGHHNGSHGHGSHLEHSIGGGSSNVSISDEGGDTSGVGPDRGGGSGSGSKETPYSRTPELRISHKLAERQRRKNMKNYFDELRDMLPVDRGPKTSKGDILQKAIEQFKILKQQNADMAREMDLLRRETGVSGSSGGGTSTYRSGGLHVGVTGGADPGPPHYPSPYGMHPDHPYAHHPSQMQHSHSMGHPMGGAAMNLPFMPGGSQPGGGPDQSRGVKNGVSGSKAD